MICLLLMLIGLPAYADDDDDYGDNLVSQVNDMCCAAGSPGDFTPSDTPGGN
jgi:hypothetical protein